MAATFDIIVNDERGGFLQFRRLFPAVSVSTDMVSALGKTLSLLWQVFLVAGPSFARMRAYLSRVRSITTDFGTERKIVDIRDILAGFFVWIGAPLPKNYITLSHLFPHALLNPGLRHCWDRLIKKCLNSLPFFASFLDGLKAVVSFIRERKPDLVRALRKAGHDDLAAYLDEQSLAPFAKWRWGTIFETCFELDKFIISFAAVVELEPFRKRAQDPTI